ncbi:23S rRNA (uracil(1939)-C(5))-methyltransferase RlmD [Coriobacteriia bacterium Es71-Z0120]|nr:23S rRNA (uracil(1939)-C(5))-methyltransferase RlmD [Parvivirga hydrogeniphila]
MRVAIQRLAYGGDGVATAPDGRTVFVPGTCPGDVVEAEVAEDHPTYLKARLLEVVEPSQDRVVPACPYFGACGGCQWQHVSYPAQIAWKRQAVEDAFARIGRVRVTVEPTVPSPREIGYRNKVELLPGRAGSALTLGFARTGTSEVVPVKACPLLPEARSALPGAAAGALRFIAGRTETPVLRVALRVASNGETEVDVWTPPGPFPRALAAKALTDATRARTITRTIVRGPASARVVRKVEVLSGPGFWTETLGSDRYVVSAPSFFQVNSGAAERLRALVADIVRQSAPAHVVDAYAGVGTFTLPLARVASTTAIESSSYALQDLRRNLERARLTADIVPGDAAHALAEAGDADLVIIDPPRAGLSPEAIDAVVRTRAPRVVYVSCDPATLARDAARLADAGYAVERAVPVDLFPQTYHVETVAVFGR